MSTLRVTVERLVVHAHPDADALELAQVGLYRAADSVCLAFAEWIDPADWSMDDERQADEGDIGSDNGGRHRAGYHPYPRLTVAHAHPLRLVALLSV